VNAEPQIWVVRAGVGGRFAQDFEREGMVAVGWGVIGDASGKTKDELERAIATAIPDGNAVSGANQVFRFVNQIQPGDLIITPDGATRELLLGQIRGPYRYLNEGVGRDEYRHAHDVTWQGRRSRDLLPQRVLYSLGSVLTVFKPQGREHLLALFSGEALEEQIDEDEDLEGSEDLVADLEARSAELVEAAIARLDGYETQALVAGVLRAMGFHTVVSMAGTDQGVDIVASRDPLGLEQRVIVQVKARPNARTGAPELVQLAGNVSPGERGMFVSTGGFTREAEGHPAARAIARVDGQRLRELFVDFYDQLDSDTKALVPLRRLYFPAD
jgi:restriction system protein